MEVVPSIKAFAPICTRIIGWLWRKEASRAPVLKRPCSLVLASTDFFFSILPTNKDLDLV